MPTAMTRPRVRPRPFRAQVGSTALYPRTYPAVMPRGISELVLIVDDVPRSAAFYRDVVGLLPATPPTPEWAWFWAASPGRAPYLALHKGPLLFEEHSPHPPGVRFGHAHFALELAAADLPAGLARLRAAAVAIHGPVRFEWMRASSWYFYDPDGNLVEYWVPDETAAASAANKGGTA